MGWRFFRRVRILPGVTLNFSKSGVSVSAGPKGMKFTMGPRGRRFTVGLPGTGISYAVTDQAKRGTTSQADSENIAKEARASIEDLRRFLANPGSEPARNEFTPLEHCPELNFLQRRLLPKAEVAFVDAFLALRDGKQEKALCHARDASQSADGALLAALLSMQIDLLEDAEDLASAALNKSGELGLLFGKYNPPFMVNLPVEEGVDLTLFGLCLETALIISALLAEEKKNYLKAIRLVRRAETCSSCPDVLRVYRVKLLTTAAPTTEETYKEVRWLRNIAQYKNRLDDSSERFLELQKGAKKILAEHVARLRQLTISPMSPPSSKLDLSSPYTSFLKIMTQQPSGSEGTLTLLLGTELHEEPRFIDLLTDYNLIIASEGQLVKTWILHVMILSALWKYGPEHFMFIVADPLEIELSVYREIPHLWRSIITTSEDLSSTLDDILAEAEDRLFVIMESGSKSVESYNAKQKNVDTAVNVKTKTKSFCHQVIFIDNVDEFILTSDDPDQLLKKLQKIAEVSRVVGVHLVATASLQFISKFGADLFQGRVAVGPSSGIALSNFLCVSETSANLPSGNMLVSQSSFGRPVAINAIQITDDDIDVITGYWAKETAHIHRGQSQYS